MRKICIDFAQGHNAHGRASRFRRRWCICANWPKHTHTHTPPHTISHTHTHRLGWLAHGCRTNELHSRVCGSFVEQTRAWKLQLTSHTHTIHNHNFCTSHWRNRAIVARRDCEIIAVLFALWIASGPIVCRETLTDQIREGTALAPGLAADAAAVTKRHKMVQVWQDAISCTAQQHSVFCADYLGICTRFRSDAHAIEPIMVRNMTIFGVRKISLGCGVCVCFPTCVCWLDVCESE